MASWFVYAYVDMCVKRTSYLCIMTLEVCARALARACARVRERVYILHMYT
jgi:hypothetical protein